MSIYKTAITDVDDVDDIVWRSVRSDVINKPGYEVCLSVSVKVTRAFTTIRRIKEDIKEAIKTQR